MSSVPAVVSLDSLRSSNPSPFIEENKTTTDRKIQKTVSFALDESRKRPASENSQLIKSQKKGTGPNEFFNYQNWLEERNQKALKEKLGEDVSKELEELFGEGNS